MRLGAKSGLFSLALVCLFIAASVSHGAVIGSWSSAPSGANTNFTFNVASDIGNVTSLELSFAPGGATSFSNEFPDNIFDSDGLLAGFRDSFLLFSPAVTSPGATQAKSETKLQAAFTGFTPFASKNVAQLIVVGGAVQPLASNIVGTADRLGTAVIETIAGDPNSRQEFPILGNAPVLPTVGDLNLQQTTLGQTVGGQVSLTNVNTLAFDNINAPMFTPLIPGKVLELPHLPTLSNQGAFSWDTNGAKRGQYKWAITGTNGGNTDGGFITVEVTVIPEPATLSLFGLALVGFAGLARRRG